MVWQSVQIYWCRGVLDIIVERRTLPELCVNADVRNAYLSSLKMTNFIQPQQAQNSIWAEAWTWINKGAFWSVRTPPRIYKPSRLVRLSLPSDTIFVSTLKAFSVYFPCETSSTVWMFVKQTCTGATMIAHSSRECLLKRRRLIKDYNQSEWRNAASISPNHADIILYVYRAVHTPNNIT